MSFRQITALLLLSVFQIEAANQPPIAKMSIVGKTLSDIKVERRLTVSTNETVCFSAAGSTDPDNDPLTYAWDFGDGSPINTELAPCHTFVTAGAYTVLLKVDDGKGPDIDAPLLTGKTPATYTLPAGWTLVRTQDFESGSVPTGEGINGSITTTYPHSGQRSLEGKVWKDDCATGWALGQNIITEDEIYCSFWEYMDAHGRLNDEMWILSIRKDFPGWTFQIERWQWLNNLGNFSRAFNVLDGNLVYFCEGSATGSPGSVCYYNQGDWLTCGFGQWRQWEVYWKSNTPGIADGVTKFYMNGTKISEVTNTAFSGTLDMSGPRITLGGEVYTKISWGQMSGECSTNAQNIDHDIGRPKNFELPCPCPGQCPPNGYAPVFNRYVDDIIVLQR